MFKALIFVLIPFLLSARPDLWPANGNVKLFKDGQYNTPLGSHSLSSIDKSSKLESFFSDNMIPLDIQSFKKYISNKKNLASYEGIWESDSGDYVLGVISTGSINEYIGYILSSTYKNWKPGQIKAEWRGVSDGIGMGTWYMRNKSKNTGTYKFSNRLISNIGNPYSNGNLIKIFPLKEDKSATGSGTAFAISNHGYLVSAYHVVDGAEKIFVNINGIKERAEIIKSDANNDLVILKVNYQFETFLNIEGTHKLSVGDEVYTAGFPYKDLLGDEIKYTEGIISSKSGLLNISSLLQTTTQIQPGNSGGPLISKESGNVIGVITSTAAIENFYKKVGTIPQNVNWSVKSDYLLPLIQDIKLASSNLINKSIKENIRGVFLITCE